ncbi:MAG: HD domain-containing protein, partial [bacterium]|nr:HD domain-containing protein [bacterium]
MSTAEEIIKYMKNPTVADMALVGKAFDFASRSHREHKRYSGEPYFTHLFETAKILAELGTGAAAIAAGFLHDAIEDVGVSAETIDKEFGAEVRMLVEGVTKLGHFRYRGVDRYSESLRRLFVASSKDVRVLIIKLADRLHNMRTLAHVPVEKQKRIATETLEIYAPIAYRLGIRKINRELEELAFPFACPEEYEKVKHLAKEKSADLERRLEKFHKSLLKGLTRHGLTQFATNHRIKGLYSLFMKLKNKEWDLAKVFDVLAIRIIVPTV